MTQHMERRMYWVRNYERIKGGASWIWHEYELGSESEIEGLLDYADSSILCGRLTEKPDNRGLYKYLLRVQVAVADSDTVLGNISESGYVLSGGLEVELIALLSIALETRFVMFSFSSGELGPAGLKFRYEFPLVHQPCTKEIDPHIVSSRKRNFYKEVPSVLDLIIATDAKHHNRLAQSFHHYAKALQFVAIDDEMVFIRLVSAIEILAKGIDLPAETDIFACRNINEIIRSDTLSKKEQKEAKKIFDVRRSKCRFVSFLMKFSNGFPWTTEEIPSHTRVKKQDLPEIASRIYNARSNYLHNGKPMYLPLRLRGEYAWDTDPSMGRVIGDQLYPVEKKLPYTYWFHRLVRYCLLNYAKSLTNDKKT